MRDHPKVGAALAPDAEPSPLNGSPWARAAAAAQAHAPYLARLMRRRPGLLKNADQDWPERLLEEALATARQIASAPTPIEEAMTELRRAKDAVHLATAIADLARAWPLHRVTGALTDFADASLRAALAVAARESAARGDIVTPVDANNPVPGLTLIAMGKMGSGELNYSSDIDFSAFFDAEVFPAGQNREARASAVRLVSLIVRVLEEITAGGYVFRTDLRLRPDPGSTQPAVALAAAEHYYQNLGQNWERAAFIKARAAAGDTSCGEVFLADLQPFIWRKHLDFAAVADVQSIKRQILSAHKSAELDSPLFNVKLGRGGIRDIELFAQTQQLILGGRNRALRTPGTVAALHELEKASVISAKVRDALEEAYIFFREVEHRIQMLEDAHTHDVPADADARARLAALCGFADLPEFEAALVSRRRVVSDIDHALFGAGPSLAAPEGSLIFTGVEDQPETLETIRKLGFSDAAMISQTIRGWHHGRIRAMRSERARELLTTLTPSLLRAFGAAGDPDQAFARFAAFFAGLSAGVQVLSLLSARPALLDLLARLFGLSPRLAASLARRPALIDAMIEPRFALPIAEDSPGERRAELRQRLDEAGGFESKLNAARRFKQDEAFRIGVQVMEGAASAAAAGAAYADLAEACVIEMAECAVAEVERLNGKAPGAFAVLALGKFGGCELSEGSDLDVMLVYEAADGSSEFYTRVTQRLISALSAQTEEGALYEVDTQLRPSGSAGPVAVRFGSFERYYSEEAWTWELLALTRLRVVAGDPALAARIEAVAGAALARPRDAEKVRAEVADMRARMERERPGKAPWDLKLAPGGLVDVEFIAQTLQLIGAAEWPEVLAANTGEALVRLTRAGVIEAGDADILQGAWSLYSDLQQVLRICVDGEFEAPRASAALRKLLSSAGGAPDFATLEAGLIAAQAAVREKFISVIGPLGDGSAPLAR